MQTIAIRAAESMLRALGGGAIVLRVPAAMAAASLNPGLGLDAPLTKDVVLSPAVLRDVARVAGTPGQAYEAIFPISALASVLERSGQSAADYLASAYGVVQQRNGIGASGAPERVLRVVGVHIERFAGEEHLVSLELRQ